MTGDLIMGRKEHAARINEAWQKTVDGVVETGLRILDARHGSSALEHGQFEKMLTEDLHFSAPTGRRLMAIASNKVLSNRTHVNALPASWGTLYELSVIANKGVDLEAQIQSGAIHPKMERKDVKALLPPPQRDDDLEETEPDPDDEAETSEGIIPAGDDDEGDSPEVIWRRGLIHRAREAISGAAFEDWSQFKADERLADTVQKAANKWCKLSHHIWVMLNYDEGEREKHYQERYFDEACDLLEVMTDETRRRFLERCAEPTTVEPAANEAPQPKKKRGRPKGSKNKPKPVVEKPTGVATPSPSIDGETDAAASAEERKALYAATEPDDGLGAPEFLRRTPAAS
jgi:hypothetical protein